MDKIYLDYAATTPLDPRVRQAMEPFFSDQFYNPSANYLAARHVRDALEEARAKVAHYLGARPSEIIFTAGATEANNLVVQGIMRRYPDAQVLVSAIEHDSILLPARQYAVSEVQVDAKGVVDAERLREAISPRTVLVSIMYANNEVGTIQPIHEIGRLIDQIRRKRQSEKNVLPLYFHTDAAQAANYLDLHVARLGVDLLSLNGSKLYGPKQSGLLYAKAGMKLVPLLLGGGQEHNLRSGTENVAGCIGLATALELAQECRQVESRRLRNLQQRFFEGIQKLGGEINGPRYANRLPNNVHCTFDGEDNERLLIGLDEAGVMAAAGSACSASSEVPSHVLRALGLHDAAAQSSLRMTMGRTTTLAEVDRTLQILKTLLKSS